MPQFTIDIPSGAIQDVADEWGYPRLDGSNPTNGEILARVKGDCIQMIKQRIRNRKQAAVTVTVPDIT